MREKWQQIEIEVKRIITKAVSDDYSSYILSQYDEISKKTFMDAVICDVIEASAWEEEGYYNEDDIRLAIGRELINRMKINI